MKQLIAFSDPKFDTPLYPRAKLEAWSNDTRRLCLAMAFSAITVVECGALDLEVNDFYFTTVRATATTYRIPGFALFTHTEYTFKVSHVNTLTGSIDKGKPKSISESMNHVRRTIVITVLHPENYTLLYIIVVLCRGQIVTDEIITAVPDRTGGVAEGK